MELPSNIAQYFNEFGINRPLGCEDGKSVMSRDLQSIAQNALREAMPRAGWSATFPGRIECTEYPQNLEVCFIIEQEMQIAVLARHHEFFPPRLHQSEFRE